MNEEEYLKLSERTLSNNFYLTEKTNKELIYTIHELLDKCDRLDQLKKIIFYGKENKLNWEDVLDTNHQINPVNDVKKQTLHAAIGVVTESIEILSSVFVSLIKNKEFDLVNISEELGDGDFYLSIFKRNFGFRDSQLRKTNIDKLAARYGDKFSDYAALNRNLDIERDILEKGIN